MDNKIYSELKNHSQILRQKHLRDLFSEDQKRFDKFSQTWNGFLVDYSKQLIDGNTWSTLTRLWQSEKVDKWITKLQTGAPINTSEKRAVLHYLLRKDNLDSLNNLDNNSICEKTLPQIHQVLAKIKKLDEDINSGKWLGKTGKKIIDIVNIGIGGSDLGPRMAEIALAKYRNPNLCIHFVANLDGADLALTLARLNPETTLFIIASKTFSTQETMQNATSARKWLTDTLGEGAVANHFVAVSTNLKEVGKFGINVNNSFEFWDWVGGRFSLWSAIGLPLALAIGFDNFKKLLSGANKMDEHFFSAPPEKNLPAILSFLEIWNTNFLETETRAVLPYSQSLSLFPRFLQQLEMESNGKSVDRDGKDLIINTSPITWGEAGTNGQHAFYQLIHQGGRKIACEFIVCKKPDYKLEGHHTKLLSNCFAQSEALMRGKTTKEVKKELSNLDENERNEIMPYKVFAGNQTSTTIVLPEITPFNIGALIALYEHKVFVSGVIWNINSFDQWGVELGKQLASHLLPIIEGRESLDNINSSTAGLINFVQKTS